MYSENDENKYKNLIDDLKNLKKIEASVGFEQKLWNKINTADSHKQQPGWGKYLTRLVPAAAMVATAVILFVVIENSANEYQDPFMIEPEERTDLIAFSTEDIQLLESEEMREQEKPKVQVQEKSSVRFRKKEVASPEVLSNERQIAGRTEAYVEEDSLVLDSQILSSSISDELIENEGRMAPAAATQMQQNLNFRQVQLSKEEQQEVIELKSKILKENRIKSP